MILHLELTEGPGHRLIPVDIDRFTIGRSSESHLQLADPQVSRRHAEIVRAGEGWRVRDCGARFGVLLNGAKVEEAPLKPGDCLQLGRTELRVVDKTVSSTTSSLGSGAVDFRQVNALLAGLRALGSSRVLDEVLALVLDSALELSGAERAFILLADAQGRLSLSLARARGSITLASAKISQRIPQEVFTTGQDRIVADLMDEAHASLHAGTVALGIRHVLCTPLTVADYGSSGSERRLGVMYLDSRERGYLAQAGALHLLASEAAVVIENARLYREVVDRERVAQELRVAALMQKALLPPPRYEGASAEIEAMTTPCRAVGGDFFDYFESDDGTLNFAVGDVAGKGPSAALLTAVVQGLLSGEADLADEPGAVLFRVNRALCRRAIEGRFVTAFYAQLTAGRVLRYCNAGHNAPILVRANSVCRLEAGGRVLGLFPVSSYETAETPVSAGDLLALFSDGVTEAENAEGVEFGDERLLAALEGCWNRPAAEMLASIRKAIADFAGEVSASDDVTVMVVAIR